MPELGAHLTNTVLSVAEMRRAEAFAIAAGTSGTELMERAGLAVAAEAARCSPAGVVAVLCGPGNNGGDGFVAARELVQRGLRVRVVLLGDRDRLGEDARRAADRWQGAVAGPDALDLEGVSLIVDALFGTGLTRPVTGDAARLIERANASGIPILAVDLASGLEGDSGRVLGIAIRASLTVTFCRPKPCHLLYPGRAHTGTLVVADIGIADEIVRYAGPSTYRVDRAMADGLVPRPLATGHKYGRGHTVVVGGPFPRIGAARLAARAALRAGSGLVTLAVPADALAAHAGRGPDALMLVEAESAGDLRNLLADARLSTVVMGPALGVGEATRAAVTAVLAVGRGTVLDADALTSFAGDAATLATALSGARAAVLTPHEGELARLLPHLAEKTGASKLVRARQAATELAAVIVLKGADTVIAAPDGRAAINTSGTPWLATAGSGDVLAGIVGAMLAQGLPAFEAAMAAVWLHGAAGERAGPGLIADDLPEAIRHVIVSLA